MDLVNLKNYENYETFNLEEVVNFDDHIHLLEIVDIKVLLNLAELVNLVDHMDLLDLEGLC